MSAVTQTRAKHLKQGVQSLPSQAELDQMLSSPRRAGSRPVVPTAEDIELLVQRRVKPWRESAAAANRKRYELRKAALCNAFYAELGVALLLAILIQLHIDPLIIVCLAGPVALIAAYWIGKSRRW